ncbi:MAG: YesL family protein [Clostridia bacterium]|nr:YesL family protein [Clostridia bacterium]
MKKKDKNQRLRIYDIARDGKGVSKSGAARDGSLKRFFISYKDNFGKIVSVNIFMVLGNFPLIFLIAVLSGVTKADAFLPMQDVFQNLAPIFSSGTQGAADMTLYALLGIQNQVLVHTTLSYVFYGISALVLFTFGLVNVGTAYILRNIAKGEPVFVWSDFWYAVRRNWRQALPFGMLDVFINAILLLNIYSLLSAGTFFETVMLWSTIVLFVLYFFMRYYVYVQMVTFKLSVFKILKNSLIFALLGFKRNIMALLGVLLFVLLEIVFVFSAGGVLLPFGVAAPLAVMFSTLAYMKVYAAYFKIKTVMIDPYLAEHPEEAPAEPEEEAIMHDDVTERERLEEIKKRNGITE